MRRNEHKLPNQVFFLSYVLFKYLNNSHKTTTKKRWYNTMATESEHSGPNSFPLGSHRKTSTRSSTCSNLYCKTEITKKI